MWLGQGAAYMLQHAAASIGWCKRLLAFFLNFLRDSYAYAKFTIEEEYELLSEGKLLDSHLFMFREQGYSTLQL